MSTARTNKTMVFSLRVIYCLMILAMLFSGIGVKPVQAASPSTISGNAGVGGATITWNGSGSGSDGSTTADGSGNYSFQVTYSWWWSGTVTPSKAGYTFSPSSRTYNYLASNQTNQNYTATAVTYTISGSVGTAGGGATITYTGGSTTANSSGSYSFTVAYGWSGTVTPSKTNYTFSPSSRNYTNVTSNQTNQNYTATLTQYTISGNAGASGVTITYSGGSTTTNSSGNYSFTFTPPWSGTVTPSRSGFSFTPASRTYNNITTSQTGQDYTPRPTSFTFGSMGDGHNEPYFEGTADQLGGLNPALVLFNGDVEDQGFVATEMNSVVSKMPSGLYNKTFMVRGNHDDKLDGSAAGWESYFETSPNIPTRPAYVVNKTALNSSSDNLNYSFDYGNSIFIGLDVPGDIVMLDQDEVDFLDARLTYAENAGLTHAFIFFHGPEYCVELEHCSCGTRDNGACTPPVFVNVINNHPIVSATFHGHEHVLSWTHMDNTRVSGLTRSYEEFGTSPAGASSYVNTIYPERVDYAYPDMAPDDQAFATVSVNGLSFTVNFYETGITQPVWSHTFSKVNNAPTISDIPDRTTDEDTATGPIPFTVGDVELNPEYLSVTATSSDPALVPAGSISLGGSGADRTINILPAANQSGSATITVSVNDGNVTVGDTFLLTVNAVNDAPVADPQSVSTSWNTPVNIVLTGSDVEGSPLSFSIVAVPLHGSLSGSGANQAYTPTAGYSGPDSFTFMANDGTADSAPATVSINVTAHTITGNVGVAAATLSYMDGTSKTVTANGSGQYSIEVPAGWSGTVTPTKAGINFSPAYMSYTNVQANLSEQNYSTDVVMLTISGNAGVAGATLSYTDGTPKTATAGETGLYSFEIPYGWSGTVTPSKTGYDFIPASRTYSNLTVNQDSQNYTVTTARVWYVDKTNPACTDTGQVGSLAVPFCTISRGAYLAQPGQIVHVLHGTYAETVYPERSGTEGNPITYLADPGVTVTGRPEAYTDPTHYTQYPGFGLGSRNYIVIDGFTIDNTSQKGIYVDASNHVTIRNNHITRAGASSQGHPYEQGIYTRNTTYSTISNNITDHNTCIGIRVVGGDHNMISNNTSYENFSLVETDAAGIELTGSSYNTVINNIVYSNEDSGINLYYWDSNSSGSHHNLIIGNLSYENGDHGIDNYQSPNNTIVGNTVQGNGTVGINFEGNTVEKGSFGAIVANNILSQNGTTPPSGSWGGNLRFDANSTTGSTTDYNLFYRTAATVQIIWNNVNYTTLAAFRTAVPSLEVHGLEGNPLFVNPVAPVLRQTGVPYDGLGIFGNYYTSAGSPAIDSANSDAPSEQEFDIDGNSRIDDPATPDTGAGTRTYDDRGAYEYLPAGPSLPVVTTQAVTGITMNSAVGNGTIAAPGLPNPTQHGVVWGLTANPTVLDNKSVEGPVSGVGTFTSNIPDLVPGTLYHVRAYATNDVGTAYGEDVTFTTLLPPAVTTQAVTNIASTTATGNGNVTALGVPNPSQHGVVWSTTANPTITDSRTTDGPVSAAGAFSSSITGLTPGTLYHMRAYATNDASTVYGEDVTFTTLIVPTVTTQPVTNILTTTAVCNGTVTSLGIPNPTQHGCVWALTANPTTANSKTTDGPVSVTGAFISTITGLTPNTLYHVRAYATNAVGTAYGEDVTFTTLLLPTVTTQAATNINTTTATGNGNVTNLGIPNPTEHGCVWGFQPNPTIAEAKTTQGPVSVSGAFTCSLTGLISGTTYHIRAYATNDGGTAYGEDRTFTTWIAPSVTTQTVTNVTQTTAMGNGTIVSLGVPNPTQYGFVWDISANPTVALPTKTEKGAATATGAFTSNITGLSLGQTYHIRAYATNEVGTAYGDDLVFTTLASSSSTTTPATNPAVGADVAGIGTGIWVNPGYITADDTSYAQVTINTATSHYLQGTNYGFAIPDNATINGITVTISRYESGASGVRDSAVRLLKAGAVTGSNKAATSTDWPSGSPVVAIYGSTADLWGTSWTPAEINAADFGVALAAVSTANRTAYVDFMQIAVTYTVSVVSSTTSVNCGAGTPVVTYGSSITCVATVTRGSGTFTPSGTVNWTHTGSGSFTPASCTLSGGNGTATCSVTYTPSAVGSGSHAITATYPGDPSFNGSNGSQNVTVNKLAASVVVTAASKTYGDADPALTGTLTGFVPADNVTAAYSRTAGETVAGGPYAITAVLSPAGVLDNYTITNTPANLTINKKDASVVVTAASKTYGDADPALTGTLTGFVPADNVTAVYSRAAGETVAGSPYTISAVLSPAGVLGNYNITNTPANFTINKKDASVVVTAASKTYGEADPALSGTLTGFVPADNVTAVYSRAAGETVAGSPYVITAVLSPAGVLGNYNITNTPANFTINKKDATVTPDALSKVIGTQDPTLTGTLTGFLPADGVTAVYTRAAGEAQGTYPITATLSPAGVLGNYNITHTPVNFTILPSPTEYTLTVNITGHGTVTKSPNQATYHYGDVVTLTATADPGWTFFNWSANAPGGVVTIHDNTTVTALFTQDEYTLTINKTGNGSVGKAPDQATYHYGDVVTLTATPDPGWSFGSWSANVVDGKVTIQANTTVTATFTQDHYTLTVDITGNGTVAKAPDQTTYVYGDEVTLTPTADPGWTFGIWSANVVGGKVIMHANTTVTATFTQDEYTLTVEKVGSGTVAADPVKTTYHYGDEVTLTATADPGWTFDNWSANVVDGKVTIQGNTTVTATFTQDEYTLTIEKVGNGTVTHAPVKTTYHYGDEVTLTATADPGWSFGSWSENVVGGKVIMHANTTVTATFTQDEYTLTVEKVGSGSVAVDPVKTTYHYGDEVTLTATPDQGWSFGSWSENVVDGKVTIQGNTTVTATFTQDEYTLTIDIVGSGTVTKDPDQATYHYGDVVTLTNNPAPGWSFASWSENVVSGQVVIHGNTNVTATFTQDEYTLVIEIVGNGTVSKAPDKATYHYGEEVTLTATPDPGWSFGSWSANADEGTITIVGNALVTVTFRQDEYTLTIDKVGNGSVTKAPDQATYHYGDVVTLAATPDPGWSFGSWSENVVGGQVTIQANTTVTATFTQDEYNLTIDKVGNGTVTKAPDQATYHYGDVVTLTATPDLGWSFGSWSENVVDGKVTIQGNTTVTATFTQDAYTLTINTVGNGTVAKDPDQTIYHYGDVVTLTASPDLGWTFTGWSGNVSGGKVTILSNTTVTATFTQDEYTLTIDKVGNGTVTKDPDQATYHYGDVVTLTATPDEGWGFVGWSENVVAGKVTIHGNTTVTATFRQYALPTVTTQAVTDITTTTATGNGNITDLGVPEPTEHGVVWSTSANPTTADSKTTDGAVSATGAFTSNITGLTPGTLYHVRAYATNIQGTVYGSDVTFTTLLAPTVTTQAVTNITSTTATGNGNINILGIPNPTQHGVVWATTVNPTTANGKTEDGPVSATGAFTSNITGLTPGTLYHVRAYATNAVGTVYGEDVSFTTLLAPTVTTQAVTAITTTTATGNGNVTVLGVPNPTQHGVVWSTTADPTIADSKTEDGPVSATGAFTSSITGLAPYTLYHVRAYATNAAGTVYGSDVSFTTLGVAPTVTTQAVTNVGQTTATGNGNVTVLGVPNPTQHGVAWATTANPTTANSKTEDGPVSGAGAFTSNITGLTPNTTYHVRAYATNAINTVYGADVQFTTGAATQVTFSSSGTWIAPAGVTSVTVEVWGGGGRGGSLSGGFGELVRGGGGGGAYSIKANIPVVPGTSYNYTVGAGSTSDSTPGGDSYFNNTSTVLAKGGSSANTSSSGAAGGAANSGVGDTRNSGGTGATGNTTSNYGGGGGSSAGTGANGATATNATGATAPSGGGNGGNGRSSSSGNGTAGSAPGGGGGGAYRSSGSSSSQTGGNGANGQIRLTYIATAVSTTTSINCGAGNPTVTYGSTINCVATVTRISGTADVTGTVSWTTSGAGSFTTSPCTLSGTGASATCNLTYNPTSVGSGSHVITAHYSGDANYLASNSNQTVTVNKKAASVTVNAAGKTYGEADPALGGTLTGFVPADNVTAVYSRTAGEAAGTYPITATLSPAGVLANYTITNTPATFTINKKAASVTPNAASKTYGEADPASFTGTLTGFLPADSVAAVYSRAAGETAGTYPISAVLSPAGVLGNYDITYNTASFTINKKDASVTPDAASKLVGDPDPVLTGSLTGFLPADNVTAAYSRAAGETVEGSPYTISAVLSPEGVLGNYNITYNTANFTINPRTEQYTLTILITGSGTVTKDPDAATYAYGTQVTLTATPGEGWSFGSWSGNVVDNKVTITADTTVTATFTRNNVAPSFASTPITAVDEDTLYTYNITATDPNTGDTLTITAPTLPAWLTFTDNGGGSATLTGTPTNANVGSHDVVLHVSDGTLSADQTFAIVVANTNDAPSFTSSPVTSATEGELYSYAVTTADPDLGAILTITATVKPEWLTLTDNGDGTATLTGTPTNAEVGIHNVTLTVSDGTASIDQVFTIDVGNTNQGPSFTSTPVTAADEDALYAYSITANDPDVGDTLTITAPTLPAWLTFTDNGNGTATLTGTPTNSEVGDHPVALQVSDGTELASQSFTITVGNVNDAPVLAQPADQSSLKGAAVSLQLSAIDVDAGASLTYSAEGLPAGLSIDPASGLISGAITGDAGPYTVTAAVDDGQGGTDSKTFTWTVTEPTYTLTVSITGNGTVARDPDQPNYLNGTEVTLTATPAEGWSFSGWSENVVDGKVTISGDTTVTATFIQNEYTLTINTVGSGTVAKSPDQATYHEGDAVTLTATPAEGWSFGSWSANVVDGKVTIHGDTVVTATFTESGQGVLHPGIADDVDPLWSYSGSWYAYNGSGPYADTDHYSSTIGDSAQIAISGGQQIKLTYVTGNNRGVMDVYIDNIKVASIDAYSASFGWRKTWTSGVLSTGPHTVRFEHSSGPYVDIDAIELRDTLPTSLLPGTADDTDILWTYTGNWVTYNGSGPSASTLHYSTSIGDTAQIAISDGQQIKLTYVIGPDRGVTDVYVDDVKVASIDAYSPMLGWQKEWSSDILTTDFHTIRFVHVSGVYSDIDAIEVIDIPPSLKPGLAEDNNILWNYSGDWWEYDGSGPTNDTLHYSITVGDSAQILVSDSQQIKLTYVTGNNRGVIDVYVDDVKVASIDAYSPIFSLRKTWLSGILTTGFHKVRFVHASGTVSDIDALEAIGTYATPSLQPGSVDDVDSLWSYTGDWTIYGGGGPASDTLHYSITVGDTAQIMVNGSQQIKLSYVTGYNRGITDVYVDDVKIASIDAYSPLFSMQRTWLSGALTTGLHTVRFVHASGSVTDIDAFEAIETYATPSLKPGSADDVDSLWGYSGDWAVYAGGGPYLDSLHYSTTIGDFAQIVVSGGKQIKLTYVTGPNRGITDVYIDEVKAASIDTYAPYFNMQQTWTSEDLTSGLHTVRIVHANGDITDIDAIEVLP